MPCAWLIWTPRRQHEVYRSAWGRAEMSAVIRDLLMHNRFEIGGRVFRNYFVARAWARHIGKPESEIKCYTM